MRRARVDPLLTGAAALLALAASTLCSPAAFADPDPAPPAPPPPNVNAYSAAKPSDFAALDGSVYAFTTGGGITCVISRASGGYGCSGALPAAPNGANTVSGGQVGAPSFSVAGTSIYAGVGKDAKPLPAGSRIGFRNVTCGYDGAVTACLNNFDQSGFVLGPAGSYIVNPSNPLLDRPEGRSPFLN